MVVGCGFVEMLNGGLTVRVIRRRESNRKGIEKSIKKKKEKKRKEKLFGGGWQWLALVWVVPWVEKDGETVGERQRVSEK